MIVCVLSTGKLDLMGILYKGALTFHELHATCTVCHRGLKAEKGSAVKCTGMKMGFLFPHRLNVPLTLAKAKGGGGLLLFVRHRSLSYYEVYTNKMLNYSSFRIKIVYHQSHRKMCTQFNRKDFCGS